MTNIERTYNMWFQVWNCEYLPLVMDRPKWNQEEENLKENDLIYFKLTDSKLSADWRFGRVEYAVTGRDGKVRSVRISYKTMIENNDKVYNENIEWKNSMIERPVRAVVKLMNVEDTSLLEDMRKVQKLVEEILMNKNGGKEIGIPDDQKDSTENTENFTDADGSEADDAMKVPEVFEKSKSKPNEVFEKSKSNPKHVDSNVKKVIRRRKTEVEKLLEDETKISREHLNRANRRKKKNPQRVQNNTKMSNTMMLKNSANTSQLIDENQDTTAAVRGVMEQGMRSEGLLVQIFRDINN